MKIAIQGIQGSFSETAALTYAKKHGLKNYEICYAVSSENVLKSLEEGLCDYGIVALENSTGGVVLETIYALSQHRCQIEALFYIMVEQSLIAKPGIQLKEITAIYSHQQALRQCKNYLATHFPKLEIFETADTALAAKELSLGKLPDTAAVICNKLCAEIYNLSVLAVGINDLKDNKTQFIAASPYKVRSPT